MHRKLDVTWQPFVIPWVSFFSPTFVGALFSFIAYSLRLVRALLTTRQDDASSFSKGKQRADVNIVIGIALR